MVGVGRFSGAFTVTNVAVLASAATQLLTQKASRGTVMIFNNGPNPIYVGPTNAVTTANGYPIPAGGKEEFDETGGAIWARAATADQVAPADTRVLVG